ncbi:MAG TPA: hypothetical protein DDW93_02720, partial [Firmicutes bacterium]|nr:hypothetical protein [Bacillota bacterium]
MAKKRGLTMKKKKKRPERAERQLELKKEILGVVYLGLAVLLFLSLKVEETGGFGQAVRGVLYMVTGKKGSLLLPVLFAALGWQLIKNHRNFSLTYRYFGVIICCLWGIVVVHLVDQGFPEAPLPYGYMEGGGLVASIILYSLDRVFSYLGTIVVLNLILVISLILMLDRPLIQFLVEMKNSVKKGIIFLFKKKNGTVSALHCQQASAAAEGRAALPDEPQLEERPRRGRETREEVEKDRETPAIVAGKSGRKLGPYQLPSLDVLQSPPRSKRNPKLLDQSSQLEETLASFGVKARVVDVHQGPVITRYEIQPAPGVKVSRIVNLSNDLALSLAARGLRIEAPIPGKSAIGIEVPNQEARMVTIREVIESRVF